jgi:hypothetical protein
MLISHQGVCCCQLKDMLNIKLLPSADVAGCCSVVLPLLAGSQGLGSSVVELRGVAADVLCSGIKTAGSAQVGASWGRPGMRHVHS